MSYERLGNSFAGSNATHFFAKADGDTSLDVCTFLDLTSLAVQDKEISLGDFKDAPLC